jgi:[glutamine synthetase] adenylyltransferase / [glutamine synthetase]-adenylyl-L-tyrosine phosphorylase
MSEDFELLAGRLPGALPAPLRPAVSLWLERLAERHPDAAAGLEAAGLDPDQLLQFVAISEFAGQQLLRHWPWFTGIAASGDLHAAPQPDWQLLSQEANEADFKQQLRILRNRSLTHILWRKLHGNAELDETLGSLSALADTLIAASEGYARRQLRSRFGDVLDSDGQHVPLVVLAMGKLGGRELNFSSDVDIIFLYPREGSSDGERSLTAQEYFTRLARRVVALLEESTADGFVYRVDTRLRPFGDSGPPVVSFAALESYLLNHGRSWERYAYVKSRVIVPAVTDATVDALRQELIEPFVYRRYLDFGIFESLRDMKSMISAEVQRREMARNIKLGPGGIREIEFIVQSLQLVRGGRVRGLRRRELRAALLALAESRGLPRAEASGLLESYAFLRRLENFIQAQRDQQTHDLPEAAEDQARVALAMGCADWPALEADIERHRAFVSERFAEVAFRGERSDHDGRGSELLAALTALCDTQADAATWQALLTRHEFRQAGEVATAISEFLQARSTQQADATARRRLTQLLPVMLLQLRTREQPAQTLRRLQNILAKVLRRSAYVALLLENRLALQRLIELCEKSAYLAEEIGRFPMLLDEMLDSRQYVAESSAETLRENLTERLASLGEVDSERRVELLGQFQRAAQFRIAAADFGGELPIMKVSDRLTDLAEIVLGEALTIAWRDLAERFGEPRFVENGENRAAGLGVIAYGKLGGIELSYGSDLDLVFLHNSRGSDQETNGAKALDNGMFFVRLARRLVHFLTIQTGTGALYDVDTRLRPSGKAGLLVTSVEAFERYQRENAWTWEHQALLRARPVAGHAGVARDFERIRADTLIGRVNRDSLRTDVAAMREKMRVQLDKSDAGQFDLKQGAGGIGDIEFLVQYLVLQNADKHPAVIHYPDNIRQLGTLGASGCLPRADVERLQDIYRRYRLRLHRLLLDEQKPYVPAAEFAAERAAVRALWQQYLVSPAGNGG